MMMARSDFRRWVAGLVQIHKDRDERCLTVGGHQGDDLILDGLHAALDLLAQARFSTISFSSLGGTMPRSCISASTSRRSSCG